MTSDHAALVSAIANVGHWRWWTGSLPGTFQVEFGGVQIYLPPGDRTLPPSGLLALRFLRPSHVGFIRRRGEPSDLPVDWPRELQADRVGPFNVSHDEFALGDASLWGEVVRQIESELVEFTDPAGGRDVQLAFWAGEVGLKIEAAEVRPVLMSGEVTLPTVAALHRDWWAYWRDYWKKRGTPEALPRDYACEVTIPLKQG